MQKLLSTTAALMLMTTAWYSHPVLANHHEDIYGAALMAEGRPEADHDADARRKPDEVLRFFGLQPGMTVIDVLAAGGYYTEVASHIVGEGGQVIMHNHTAFKNTSKEAHDLRFHDGRLSNVVDFVMDNDVLDFGDVEADMVLFILGFHDNYYFADNWPHVDEAKFMTAIVNAMKPGAVLGIVDHRAAEGTTTETGNDIHRISRSNVIEIMARYGLTLDAESDILANPEDDLDKPMYDPSIRGNTDRLVMRFRKAQ